MYTQGKGNHWQKDAPEVIWSFVLSSSVGVVTDFCRSLSVVSGVSITSSIKIIINTITIMQLQMYSNVLIKHLSSRAALNRNFVKR